VESPFGTSGALTPASNGHSSATPSLDRDSQEGRAATPSESPTVSPACSRLRLSASYWGYVQHVTGSNADGLKPLHVLEFLLHFGGSVHKAGSLAAELFDRFGSLGAVVAAEPSKLAEVLHDDLSVALLKAVRAAVKAIVREPLEDRPVIGSKSALMDYLSVTMRHEPIEATRILFLDRKNALIKDEIQNRGTVDHTPLYPREVVRRVIELGASAIILVHNHPTDDVTPSRADIAMTCQLAAALKAINVVLHDHVIVGRSREISLRKSKLI
jgi:DNA repair protein RadC